MSFPTLIATEPKVRVRKFLGHWVVQRPIEIDNHQVWEYVAHYDTWPVAFRIANMVAHPESWITYMGEVNG